MLSEGFDRPAWHGPNLRGAIRGLDAKQASRRPGPKRHNIWEIVAHAAYWKFVVRRRLAGEKRESFPLSGGNWFPAPRKIDEDAWRSIVRLLVDEHRKLVQVVSTLDDATLRTRPRGSRHATIRTVAGIAAHDVYHAGQIQLIKRLAAR
jgi:hypothetical protein